MGNIFKSSFAECHLIIKYGELTSPLTASLPLATWLCFPSFGLPLPATAKSLQSCPTPCDPIDSSPPGSRPWDSPGKNTGVGCRFLLQCMKVKGKSLSHVWLFVTPWTAAHQAPLSMGFSRQEYWSGVPLPSSPLPKLYKIQIILGWWHFLIIGPCMDLFKQLIIFISNLPPEWAIFFSSLNGDTTYIAGTMLKKRR